METPTRDPSPTPPQPMPGPSAEGPRGGRGMGRGGRGGNLLWVCFHTEYKILEIYLYTENYANVVTFTKQLHNRAHTLKMGQSCVESCFASIPNSQ